MDSRPEWLKIGQLVQVAEWPGRIIDIAETEKGNVMVLVESPKAIWRGQKPEWLVYKEGMIKPVSDFSDIAIRFRVYIEHVEKMRDDLHKMREEWVGKNG